MKTGEKKAAETGDRPDSLSDYTRLIMRRVERDYMVIFGIDLKAETMEVLRDKSARIFGGVGSINPYEEAMRRMAALFEGETMEFYVRMSNVEYVRRKFAIEDKLSFSYRASYGDWGWRTVQFMVLTRAKDGAPERMALSIVRMDAEAGERAALQQAMRKTLELSVAANRRTELLHKLIKSAFWTLKFNEKRQIVHQEFSPGLSEVLKNDVRDLDVWTALVHPDYVEAAKAASSKALMDRTGASSFDSEYPIRARDGSYHWIRSAGSVILNPSGDGELCGICVDIDESVKHRQNELRALDEAHALERANAAKSRFFSMVSHDIRTPLNAIIGYAELLKLGIADEKEREMAIKSVLVSGQSLLELINDVLDLSKLEAGKMEVIPEPADALQLVQDIADAARASAMNKSIEIRTAAQPMPWLRFDPHRVRQILFNLVGNAVKFTTRGYVEIRVSYARDSSPDPSVGATLKGKLQFEVRDTGCGMTEEQQKMIAEPYVQFGSSANRSKGTGLGLPICTQLVARMNGVIELESAPGRGTTFRVILPTIEEEDDTRRQRLSATQRIRYAVKRGVVRKYVNALIVDDQPMNRLVLKSMITRFGVKKVSMAANGAEALAKMRTERFDLVLTDMWMPEMDGESLVCEIRKHPVWKTLPVYAITADVESQKTAAALGFTGSLLKPVTIESLRTVFTH